MMPLARELAGDCHVYVPDQPGFGGSGHPEHVPDMAGLADALAGGTRNFGFCDATFVGNSQGCQIIALLALCHPELVAAAVLQGPPAPPGERTWFWQFVRWRQNVPYNPPSLDPVTRPEYRKAGYLCVLRTFQHSLNDNRRAGNRLIENAVWSYERPNPIAGPIKDLFAFEWDMVDPLVRRGRGGLRACARSLSPGRCAAEHPEDPNHLRRRDDRPHPARLIPVRNRTADPVLHPPGGCPDGVLGSTSQAHDLTLQRSGLILDDPGRRPHRR
ncbi:MAG: alpha/beta hydrolase [Alphaproteobacteria bacterium]|nr:alpha/beta hydrolase [Alphaproteobacteria bacterium]